MNGSEYVADGFEKKAMGVYAQSRVLTASPSELIVMLYDEAIRNMKIACENIGRKDLVAANRAIARAQDVVGELWSALNVDAGDIAHFLDSLYDYVYRSLVTANVKKDPDILTGCIKVMEEIREAWGEIASQSRLSGGQQGVHQECGRCT